MHVIILLSNSNFACRSDYDTSEDEGNEKKHQTGDENLFTYDEHSALCTFWDR